MNPIRVLIADDHGLVRSGLRQVLATAADLQVVGEAADGTQLLQRLAELPADVVLLDLAMPGLAGVALIRRLRELHPAPALLVVSMHDEGPMVAHALRAGAAGYVTKDSDLDTLLAAVRRVAGGGRYIDPSLVDSVLFPAAAGDAPPHRALSPRETQILELIAAGQPLGAIADALRLSPKTVSTHKMRLMQKLQVDSNAELLKYAIRHGLTPEA